MSETGNRTNAGYNIFVAVPVSDDTEVVIGYKQTSLGDQYVCWYANSNGYYWGKYCHTYRDALTYLTERLENYINV